MADYPKFTFDKWKQLAGDIKSNMTPEELEEYEKFKAYAIIGQATIISDPDDLPLSLSYNKFLYLISRNRGQQMPMCGSCSFFGKEDAEGWGWCAIKEHSCLCCDQCELDHTKINPRQIAKALHFIQKWRRGANVKMPLPYVVGKVNDAAIYQLRNQERERREFDKKWQELEDAARVRRGDLVLIRGEYKGIVASVKVINGYYLIEFEHRTNGRVNRFLALPEDVKILFRKY